MMDIAKNIQNLSALFIIIIVLFIAFTTYIVYFAGRILNAVEWIAYGDAQDEEDEEF